MIVFEKAKELSSWWIKFWTRKRRLKKMWDISRWFRRDWDNTYYQTDYKRSKRRKHLRHFSNRKLRRYNLDIGSWWAYKKLYDLKWFLD